MRSYLDGLFRYTEFAGRAGRAQYWLFHLVACLVLAATAVVEYRLQGLPPRAISSLPVFSLLLLFHVLPSIAITVRRLHDVGRSGWWYWLTAAPPICIVLLYWTLLLPSEPGSNRYGNATGSNRSSGRARQAGAIPADRLAIATGQRTPNSYRLGPSEGRFI